MIVTIFLGLNIEISEKRKPIRRLTLQKEDSFTQLKIVDAVMHGMAVFHMHIAHGVVIHMVMILHRHLVMIIVTPIQLDVGENVKCPVGAQLKRQGFWRYEQTT